MAIDLDRPAALYDDAARLSRRRRWPYLLGAALLALMLVPPLLAHGHTPTKAPTPPPPAAPPPQRPDSAQPEGDTEAGAQAAAANDVVAYSGQQMFATASRHALVARLAAPAVVDALQAQFDAAFGQAAARYGLDQDGKPPAGLTFVCRALPVGVRTVSFTPQRATIDVWSAGLIGLAGQRSTQPVAETWQTTRLDLLWTDGGWRWLQATQTDGPVPVSGMQPPSSASDIADAARSFQGLTYAR